MLLLIIKITPEHILEKLATDSDEWVAYNVVANLSTTPKIHIMLAKHPTDMVRIELASQRNIPLGAFRILAKDSNHNVKMAVVNNLSCPLEVLKKLAADETDKGVASIAKMAADRKRT